TGLREGQRTAQVLLLGRIVPNKKLPPLRVNIVIAMHAELRDEALHDAEKTPLVEVAHVGQLMKAVGATRRPRARSLHHEVSLRSLKLHAKDLGNNGFRRRLLASRRDQRQKRGAGGSSTLLRFRFAPRR